MQRPLCVSKFNRNMKPLFTRKNLAINDLIDFREAKTIYNYTDYFKNKDPNSKEYLEWKIKFLPKEFKSLNEEINQVIFTSNDRTIKVLFEELKQNIKDYDLLNVSREKFIKVCEEWNKQEYEKFIKQVEKLSEEYFDKPERKKYKHLEEYETYYPAFGFIDKFEKNKVKNKNFFCIETVPPLIDIDYLNSYLTILENLTSKFQDSFFSELRLYENGDIFKEPDSNLWDKVVFRLKNNRFVVGILLGFAIFSGLSLLFNSITEKIDYFSNMKKGNQEQVDTTFINQRKDTIK